jgi:hypothetical protein
MPQEAKNLEGLLLKRRRKFTGRIFGHWKQDDG